MNEYKVWLAKILTVTVLVVVGGMVLAGAGAAAGGLAGPRVAVVELEGPIEDSNDVLKAL